MADIRARQLAEDAMAQARSLVMERRELRAENAQLQAALNFARIDRADLERSLRQLVADERRVRRWAVTAYVLSAPLHFLLGLAVGWYNF